MQRLLYNTARNLSARDRRATSTSAAKPKKAKAPNTKPATVVKPSVTGAGDKGPGSEAAVVNVQDTDEDEASPSSQLHRSTQCFDKSSNAYERAVVLMDGGITLKEFREDLQRSMNVWMQSTKRRKTKEKVEELLLLLQGTQENGPWNEIVEEWKPHLQRLPANM